MKIFVFDFDGVISNSIDECYLVSNLTFEGKSILSEDNLSLYGFGVNRMVFNNYRYLVGPANEYFFLLKSLYDHQKDPSVSVLDRFKKYKNEEYEESMVFVQEFFRTRNRIKQEFLSSWLKLNPLYAEMKEILTKCIDRSENHCFIASTKDEDSIYSILQDNKVRFKRDNILGKEHGADKKVLLKTILEKTGDRPSDTYFFDDNHNHLSRVYGLGIHLFLASWGYCSSDSKELVKEIKASPITINDLNHLISD